MNLNKKECNALMSAYQKADSQYEQHKGNSVNSPFYDLRNKNYESLKYFCEKWKFDYPQLKTVIKKINKL
jgi:hypothetical protein